MYIYIYIYKQHGAFKCVCASHRVCLSMCEYNLENSVNSYTDKQILVHAQARTVWAFVCGYTLGYVQCARLCVGIL